MIEDGKRIAGKRSLSSILHHPSSVRLAGIGRLVWRNRWSRVREALAQFVYGMTGYGFARYALEARHELESIFMVVTLGDLIGIPVLPPVYSLRLLPYVAPEIEMWKRHMARQKEFWEREEFDLHGV